jgi:hypothetical protein
MAITELEFAEKVKSKYPQYKDIDDTELVSLVLERYPEYKTQLGEKEYSKNLLTNSAKTLVSGGVQAAINAGAGVSQSYSMLLGDKSDTSEEAIEEYASQRRVKQRKGGSRMAKGKILAHRKRKNEVIQSLNENSHRLRNLANSTDERFNIDPEFANSFGGQVLKGFGQMIGNIGAAVAGTAVAGPVGGVAAAVGTIAPQMVSEAVSDSEATLGKSYMDMTEEEKDQVALATAGYATLGTALEFAPVARIPWVKNFLRGKTKVPAGVLKSPSVRREIAKGFAAEGFTEAAQGQLLDSLARATFDDDRELMSWDVLRQRFNEFAVGGIVGGGTSGGIATVQKAARGELFKPKETKEVQTDEMTKEVFEITYTDKNTGNEVKGIEIDAENQEEAIKIAGERLSELAFEGTIVARPKPPPTGGAADDDLEPGVTVEEEVIPEAEQAELQEELQEDITAGAAPVQTIDFIKGASGDPAQNLASRKRRRAGTGEGKNPSLRLEVNGLPIYIGKDSERGGKSFEGWAEETSAWFTDQEINNAAGWYDSLKSKFTKEFGPERGPKMMLAWLASQQNESPAGGVRNTFRVIDRLTGIKSGKKGGLADEKLEAIFTDTLADKGLDAKLSDFIDAGMGKRTRTFMGDDADGGMPFVADVHTGRDSGKLDQQTLTRIKRFADNGVLTVNGQPASVDITEVKEKKVKGKTKTEPEKAILRVGGQEVELVRDLTGSPSKGEYEGISDWGNRLTDYLNSIGWKGRTDWIPAEVQAVGWMRTLRQYGLKESDLESSLIENTFRVAAEVDYGLGSKITQIYPDFQKLNEQQKTVITEDVLGFIVPRVQQEMAPSAILRDSEFGIGSWEGSVSPSGNFYVMGSDEAANIFTNSLAWVTEQAGTMQAVIGKGGKNQRAVALVGLSNNELSNFVDFVNQLQTGTDKKTAKEAEALRGFSTRAMPGEQGIIVFGLTESKARGVENTLQKFADQYTGADSLTIRNFSAVTKFTENNWKDNQNGESYIREIEQSGSTGNIRERLLRLREQYGQRLAETGQRVAPEVFGGTSIQSRVDQFVEAGKEYLEGTGTDVIAEAAPTDETAQVAPTDPGGTFNQNTLDQFITKNFLPLSRKIGSDIVPNYTVPLAQYNATQGVIEYNPAALAQRDQQYVTAAMREEMIHAAMSKVILKKAKGKDEGKAFKSFMESLGKSLTPEQRTAISQVYQGLETDAQFGAEYSRAAIQQLLYGNVTESFITEGRAFDKIKSLLKSVQAYIAKTFKADVTTDPEAAAIIVESARLLQAVDPNAKPVEQKAINESMAYSEDVNPNAEVTSEQVAESGKPPSEKKLNINFARKYLFTVSSLLNSIHPRLKKLVRDYYGAIQGEVLDYQKRVAPFFKKYRGIKNADDRKRLKQLLSYSPVEQEGVDPLIEERDALLRKYDLFNDYQLEIRPVLNELYNRLGNEGIMIGFLEQYFPRSIKDLDKVKNRAGKELRDAFREFIKARNERIEEARTRIEAGNPRPGDVELSKETTIQIGNPKTAALEAQQWDQFTRGFSGEGANRRRNLPGNFLSRSNAKELEVIPENLLDAYEDPGAAMERYIYNAVTAIQTTRLMGSKFANVPEGLKVPPASELGLLIQELRANGEISMEDADGTVPDIFAMILSPMQVENMFFQLARTFGYGTLLVEFTSTLSQLYDLPFIMLDNGIFGTAVAMFGPRLKGDDFGIDVNQVSAEFAADNRVLEKAVRLGLRATGFTKLDQVMKETNMTANYNRYRKLARGYFKDRNSANSKKFVAELTSMGYSEQEQTQLIADLKKGDRDSAYIRTLLFNKLSETQPLTKAEMALGIVGNPNLRFTVAMKSFMIKQLNFVKDRMVNEFIDGVRTGDAKKIRKASNDMALLMTFLLLIGLPVDALKDFLAGRLGYMSDYLFNGVFRIAGISRYTAYQARKEGVGQAAFDYVTPVAIQQFVDMTSEVGRVARGERAITESKFVTLLPFSDVINRIFGFQQGRERKEYMRRVREGERPFIVPPGAL